jgi:hypothetical protein
MLPKVADLRTLGRKRNPTRHRDISRRVRQPGVTHEVAVADSFSDLFTYKPLHFARARILHDMPLVMLFRKKNAPMLLAALAAAGCVGEIADGAGGGGGPGAGGPGKVSVSLCADRPFSRRLTLDEYLASVQDALGVDIRGEAQTTFPTDLRADGFSNTATALIVTDQHIEAYESLATLAVDKIGDFSAFVATQTSCTDFTQSCQSEFIETLGKRVLRGSITTQESAALDPLFAVAKDEGEPFEAGARLVTQALLQFPRFVYRIENETGDGKARKLSGLELASRLSFLLWGAPPDTALLEAKLDTDAQIASQVQRMLQQPGARTRAATFVTDWLNLSRLPTLTRDSKRFPDWTPALGAAMLDETKRFFEAVAFEEQAPLSSLFNAKYTFTSPALADHYGLTADSEGRVDLSSDEARGGLLTQGAILTVGGNSESMVGRGLFLLENVLCGHIDSPPPGVDTTPPDVGAGATQRVHSESRVDNPSCGGCHSQMEPTAWGIERFDAVGRFRMQDDFGNDLKQDGYVLFPGDEQPTPYTTTRELNEHLAQSPAVRACLAQKVSQFAFGRPLARSDEPLDLCAIEDVQSRFEQSAGSFEDLVVAIVQSNAFRKIQTEKP